MTGPIPGQPPPHQPGQQPPRQPPPYPPHPPQQRPPRERPPQQPPPQQPPPPRQPDWGQDPDWDPPTERHQTGWQQPSVPEQTGWDEPTQRHQTGGWQQVAPAPEQRQPASTMTRAESRAQARTGTAATLVAIGVGALVAVGLGVYGRLHEPQFFAFNVAGFSNGLAAKAWLASGAFLLALVQITSAMIMYGKIKIKSPPWIGTLHRWSGRVAVLLTVPVAVHCLYALGFQTGEPRVLVHSVFGCFFYGAFVTKMLVLNQSKSPGWALPAAGGAVFSALVALWSTASAWFFVTSGLTF